MVLNHKRLPCHGYLVHMAITCLQSIVRTHYSSVFVFLRPVQHDEEKWLVFFLSHERPSKGLARCRQLDLCTVLQPTARLTNSLSPSWLCIKHNTLRGRTSPIVWARVWTRALCRHIVPLFLSSHSALSSSRSKWLHQKKTSGPFTSYLWTIFVVELIKELRSDKELQTGGSIWPRDLLLWLFLKHAKSETSFKSLIENITVTLP